MSPITTSTYVDIYASRTGNVSVLLRVIDISVVKFDICVLNLTFDDKVPSKTTV